MGTLSKARQPSNYRPAGKKCGWAGTTWKKGAVMPVEACLQEGSVEATSSASCCLETTHTHTLALETDRGDGKEPR